MINTVKSLRFLYCLSVVLYIVLAVNPATASTPAKQEVQSDTWFYYATDDEGTSYSLNPANVERLEGNLIKVWVRAVYPEKNPKYKEGLTQWELNCAKKTMRGITSSIKKKDGTSAAITAPSDWSDIPNDSTADSLFEVTCGAKGKKK